MKWFRFYSEVWHDPKVERLPAPLFKHWVMLLCLASEGSPRGSLPADERVVAYSLRVNVAQSRRVISQLCERGLLDQIEGRFIPHNWDARQPLSDNAAARMRRTRSEHVPNKFGLDTDTESDKETERDKEQPQPPTPSPETELKIVRQNIFSLYEQVFGSRLTPQMEAVLRETEQEYPVPWIEEAFKEAAISGARSWRYVDKVLRNWKAEEDNDLAEAQKWGLEGDEAVAFAETVREQRVAQ